MKHTALTFGLFATLCVDGAKQPEEAVQICTTDSPIAVVIV